MKKNPFEGLTSDEIEEEYSRQVTLAKIKAACIFVFAELIIITFYYLFPFHNTMTFLNYILHQNKVFIIIVIVLLVYLIF